MTKLEIFRRDASVGAHVTLRLTRGEDVSGCVDALDDACIRVHTEGRTVTVFEDLLAGWEIHHGSPSQTVAGRAVETPSRQLPVAANAPPSTSAPETLEEFTRIKAKFSAAVPRARLEPPDPDFRFPETEFPPHVVPDVRREWDQVRDRYSYALKVKELNRLNSIVAQILAPLQSRYPGSATTRALLGRVLLKLNRQSDALEHLSAAAALSDAPEQWLALAAAACENSALQCYALRRYFRLAPPTRGEDPWFRYLAVALEHCDLRNAAQIIRHWQEELETATEVRRLLSESVIYLLSRLEADALAMRAANTLVRSSANLSPDWEEALVNGAPCSDELLATEERFVRPTVPTPAAAAGPVSPLYANDGTPSGRIASFGNQRFGFIDAHSGGTHYFRIDDVADERLRDALLDGSWRTFGAVEFQLLPSYGHKYDRATDVLPLQNSDSLLERARHLLTIGQAPKAMPLVRRLLAADPNDPAACQLEREIKEEIRKGLRDGTGLPKGKGPYARAKRAQLVDLDLQKAEELLNQAIQQKDKPESAVKDLASLLNQLGRVNEAITLLENNSKRTRGVSPYDNMLATLYQHADRHDEAIRVLKRLHGGTSGPKKNSLLTRIALSHLRCSRYDDAERVLGQLLVADPHDRTGLRLKAALEDARQAVSSAEVDEIIYSLGRLGDEGVELSSLARAAIEQCTYEGVDPARVQTGAAGQRDVTRVVELAKALGTKTPRDRAVYYLSAAALLKLNVHDSEPVRIYDYLRRYFTSMADASWIDKKPADVVRSYYIESLALVEDDNLDEAWRTLIRYLATFSSNVLKDVEAMLPRTHRRGDSIPPRRYIDTLQKALQMVGPKAGSEWRDGLIAVGSQSSFAKRSLGEAFVTPPILQSAFGELLGDSSHDADALQSTWHDQCREHARTHRRRLFDCRALSRALTASPATVASMEELGKQVRKAMEGTTVRLDKRRLNTLGDIIDAALAYCRASDFEERERNYLLLTAQAEDFGKKVAEEPTQYSHEGLLPVADHVKSLIEEEYAQMVRTSGAELGLRLLVDKYVRGQHGELRLQIEVSNQDGCSPASSVRIRLGPEDSEYFAAECWEREVMSTLRGGHTETAHMVIHPKGTAVRDRAFPINATGIYLNRLGEEQGTADQAWTVRLYGDEEFRHLENPYAPYAEGGPVDEPAMFVGRDDLLNRLEDSLLSGSSSKSIVMFGQKRAGKSSLIVHLRDRLVRRNHVLPISFSLQEIAPELSVATLFYRILKGVSEALDELRFDGREVPAFSPPGIETLETHPGLEFHENMASVVQRMKNHSSGLRIVLLVDEFTDVFKGIRNERIPSEFMKAWKAIIEKKYFASVLVGQDIMPAFKKEFPNEFGVTEDFRVTYLDDAAAKDLVTRPIGKERFAGRAVRRLLDLTANSPYYTMMFCARLVDYMNETRSVVVTEADILSVEDGMLRGDRRLMRERFDNLLTAGDGMRDSGIDPGATYNVCVAIARGSREGWCGRESVNREFADGDPHELLLDLETREVVERKGTAYRLRVGLFRDWLLAQD